MWWWPVFGTRHDSIFKSSNDQSGMGHGVWWYCIAYSLILYCHKFITTHIPTESSILRDIFGATSWIKKQCHHNLHLIQSITQLNEERWIRAATITAYLCWAHPQQKDVFLPAISTKFIFRAWKLKVCNANSWNFGSFGVFVYRLRQLCLCPKSLKILGDSIERRTCYLFEQH